MDTYIGTNNTKIAREIYISGNFTNGKWYADRASMAASALQGVQTVLIYGGNVQSISLVNILKTEPETYGLTVLNCGNLQKWQGD